MMKDEKTKTLEFLNVVVDYKGESTTSEFRGARNNSGPGHLLRKGQQPQRPAHLDRGVEEKLLTRISVKHLQ